VCRTGAYGKYNTTIRRIEMRPLGLCLATALLVAACGGTATTASPSPSPTASPTAAPTLVAKVATDAKLGKILVDETTSKTLYTWAKDTDENSQCYDQCATFWPPLITTAKIVAGDGVTTGKFGTSARKDGALQVTFNGHPLYFFQRDAAPGDTNGQGNTGFGAVWLVVNIP
jgi:predicted lipoprotein with Yx(FWY)xxD motif